MPDTAEKRMRLISACVWLVLAIFFFLVLDQPLKYPVAGALLLVSLMLFFFYSQS